METWKVVSLADKYEVSQLGRIRNRKTKQVLKPHLGTRYPRVSLEQTIDRHIMTVKNYFVHRLVALEFVKNPHNYNTINHIDANKENNHYTNLEWCTQKQNIHHSRYTTKNGAVISTQKIMHIYNSNPKLSKEEFLSAIITNCR